MNNIVDFKKPKPSNQPPLKEPPLINLPPATKYLLILIISIHLALSFGVSDETHGYILFNYGFTPAIWTGQSAYGFDMNALVSPLSYIVLHGGFMHLFMNAAMLMAFGAGVEKWMGAKRFILFFFLCGIAAAFVEMIIHPFSGFPVIGASGAESGLFAAILILLQRQGQLPTGKYGIWPFAAFWIILSVVLGFVGGQLMGGEIAWAAHLGGFIAGFALLKLNYFRVS